MEIRPLEPADIDAVRRIAHESLAASYSVLRDETIETAIEEWYAADMFDEYLDRDEMVFLVAADDDDIVGFSQSHILETIDKGRILWLHVDPEHRGRSIATNLFNTTRELLEERGTKRITGLVLAENEEGNQFYTTHGFEKLYDRTITIADKAHVENVYGEEGTELSELEPRTATDGEQIYVDFAESSRGADGPFHPSYLDQDRNQLYGWYCSSCETTNNAMDSMGHIECSQCGNLRKATRWDAAYL
jgi:ribosomal protein S18 acetylase RimI-like enzyme